MEDTFASFARVTALMIEIVAVLIVTYGCAEAFVTLVRIPFRGRVTHGERKVVWRRLGMWLLLGLEFELAADIVASVISPSWMDIGQLGAIAAIRTFLNYFLEKDLEQSATAEGRAAEVAPA